MEFKTARERRQALTGAAVRTRDKWGPVATPAPILIPGPSRERPGPRHPHFARLDTPRDGEDLGCDSLRQRRARGT